MKTTKDPSDPPIVKNLGHEALHDLVHFDRKIFKTIPVLMFRPGLLTQAALGAERDKYVKPFTLFVFINFLFFMIKSRSIFGYTLETYAYQFAPFIKRKQADLHLTLQVMSERFNTAILFEEKEYLVLMVPLFALIVMILYLKKRLHYARHIIFSLHFYSFFIILLWLLVVIFRLFQRLLDLGHFNMNLTHSEQPFIYITIICAGVYLFIALKRLYQQNGLVTGLKSAILSISVIGLIVYVYRLALFFIVMRSIAE